MSGQDARIEAVAQAIAAAAGEDRDREDAALKWLALLIEAREMNVSAHKDDWLTERQKMIYEEATRFLDDLVSQGCSGESREER